MTSPSETNSPLRVPTLVHDTWVYVPDSRPPPVNATKYAFVSTEHALAEHEMSHCVGLPTKLRGVSEAVPTDEENGKCNSSTCTNVGILTSTSMVFTNHVTHDWYSYASFSFCSLLKFTRTDKYFL